MLRKCPVCNAQESRILRHMEMEVPENVYLPKSYDIVACDKCGFSYAKSAGVTQETYNEYYRDSNDYGDEKIRIELNRELNEARINLMKKYIPLNAEIVDIGCGNGDFLAELKKGNYKNLNGIDPSADSVKVVNKRGIHAWTGNIFDEETGSKKYDVVCCTAVLEHIYDLQGCLEKLKARLKGIGSKIFVDVPGMEGINEYLAMPAEHFNCEHINYFTFQSLDNLFYANGFKRISKKEDYYVFLKKNRVPVLDIGAVYELVEQPVGDMKKDTKAAEMILRYFSTVEKRLFQENESLRKTLMEEKHIVVWGGGNYAFQMLSFVPEMKGKIDFFIDSNSSKLGRKIVGKEIRSVGEMPRDGTLVIICSMNYSEEMAAECEKQSVRYYIY